MAEIRRVGDAPEAMTKNVAEVLSDATGEKVLPGDIVFIVTAEGDDYRVTIMREYEGRHWFRHFKLVEQDDGTLVYEIPVFFVIPPPEMTTEGFGPSQGGEVH